MIAIVYRLLIELVVWVEVVFSNHEVHSLHRHVSRGDHHYQATDYRAHRLHLKFFPSYLN